MYNTNNYKNYQLKLVGNLLYYIALIVWTIITQVNSSTIETVFLIDKNIFSSLLVKVVEIILIMKILLFSEYRIKEIFRLSIGIIVVIIISYYAEKYDVLFLFLFIAASKNIKLENVAKIIFYSLIATTIVIIGLALLGGILNTIFIRNTRVGYGMGFSHPNVCGHVILSICILRVYLIYDKIKIRDYIGLITTLFITLLVTMSRSSVFMMILLIFMMILKKYIQTPNIYKILKNNCKLFAIMLPTISIVLGIIYSSSNSLMVKINDILSDRILWENIYYQNYGIKVFGTKIISNSSVEIYNYNKNMQVLDNAYMNYMISYGTIFIILFVFAYYWFIHNIEIQYISLIICILMALLSGVSDNYILSIPYNFTLIGFGSIIYGGKSIIGSKKQLIA